MAAPYRAVLVSVRALGGHNYGIETNLDDTVLYLKQQLSRMHHLGPVEALRLIYAGRALVDTTTLRDLDYYHQGGNITVLVRPPPPASTDGGGGDTAVPDATTTDDRARCRPAEHTRVLTRGLRIRWP